MDEGDAEDHDGVSFNAFPPPREVVRGGLVGSDLVFSTQLQAKGARSSDRFFMCANKGSGEPGQLD